MEDVSSEVANEEVPINENFSRVGWAELFAKNGFTTSGLNLYYSGGQWPVNGVMTTIAAGGPVALTASIDNYVGITQSGALANAGATASPLHAPAFKITCDGSAITAVVDLRNASHLAKHAHGITSIALTTANVTLTQAQALCDTLVVTGVLTASRDLIVPLLRRRWVVRHTGSAFDARVIGATGTGITIGIGKVAIVECDGANVLRVTADA